MNVQIISANVTARHKPIITSDHREVPAEESDHCAIEIVIGRHSSGVLAHFDTCWNDDMEIALVFAQSAIELQVQAPTPPTSTRDGTRRLR